MGRQGKLPSRSDVLAKRKLNRTEERVGVKRKGVLSTGNRNGCSTFHLCAWIGDITLRGECSLHHEGPCQPSEFEPYPEGSERPAMGVLTEG